MALAMMLVCLPVAARADGDPASDVLASQPLFLPADGAISNRRQAELSAFARSIDRSGYALRVAVIATPADLGSVTELWRRPSGYAHFLGLELSLVYGGTVLVAMPNGFGVYRTHGLSPAERRAVPMGTAPGPGPGLATGTLSVMQKLAVAAGHRLSLPSAQAGRTARPPSPATWVAYLAGALIIALTWAASLRAQPLGTPGRTAG